VSYDVNVTIPTIFFSAIFFLVLFPFNVHVVKEYERAVIFRLGRVAGVFGPGLFATLPFLDRTIIVDVREDFIDIPRQEVLTKDSVTMFVDAVVYYRIFDPHRSITRIDNYARGVSTITASVFRSVLGEKKLDEILQGRRQLAARIKELLDVETRPWGLDVTRVEMTELKLPADMVRSMAVAAEAERANKSRLIYAEGERSALVISAEAEAQAAAAARAASDTLSTPQALQMRYLKSLTSLAERARENIIIFPLPVDYSQPGMSSIAGATSSSSSSTGTGGTTAHLSPYPPSSGTGGVALSTATATTT